MRLPLLFATVISLAFAGCIGGDDTPVETASNDMSGQASAGATGAQASASASESMSNASATLDTPPEPVIVPVEYSGSFSNAVTVCQRSPSSMSCNALGGSSSDSTEPSFTGVVKSGEVTMTWEATNPRMATLIMHVYACNDEGCDATIVKGASPLTATFTGVKATSLTLAFMTEPVDAGDVAVMVATDQAFEVVGTITTLPS